MEKNVNTKSANYKTLLLGSGTSIIITMALLLLFAIILVNTSIKDTAIKPVVIIITALGIFIGSSLSTLKIKKSGLIYGAIIGLIDILVMYIISSTAISNFSLNLESLIMIIASIIAGMLGGIIGVNMK